MHLYGGTLPDQHATLHPSLLRVSMPEVSHSCSYCGAAVGCLLGLLVVRGRYAKNLQASTPSQDEAMRVELGPSLALTLINISFLLGVYVALYRLPCAGIQDSGGSAGAKFATKLSHLARP